MPDVPISTLLSWTWIAYTIEADNAFEALSASRVGRHFRISLPMWTQGLRFIDEQGTTVEQLQTRARARCNLGGLERWGWISLGDSNGAHRRGYGTGRGIRDSTVLRPTRAGSYARKLWPKVVDGVEERWVASFGKERVEALQSSLADFDTKMPWSPPETAPSNGFLTQVVPSDFVDVDPPLVARLGQALTALTLDYERESKWSLPLGANGLRVVGTQSVQVRDLPALSGISKEGMAMALGFMQRNRLAGEPSSRAVSLTPRGLDALKEYRSRSAKGKHQPLREALTAILNQREALTAGLVPPEGCWRGEKPYLRQTQRMLKDPTAALPWHPMVLHRGGWPDGS